MMVAATAVRARAIGTVTSAATIRRMATIVAEKRACRRRCDRRGVLVGLRLMLIGRTERS